MRNGWTGIDLHNVKVDYARTRASDSKHLLAVILNVFFSEYTRVMINIVISI